MPTDVSLSSSSNDASEVGERSCSLMPSPQDRKGTGRGRSRSVASLAQGRRKPVISSGNCGAAGRGVGSRNWVDSRGSAMPRGRSSNRRSPGNRSNRPLELHPRQCIRDRSVESCRSRSRSILGRRRLTDVRRRELSGSVAAKRKACPLRDGQRREEAESQKHQPSRPPRRTSSQLKSLCRPPPHAPPQLQRGRRPSARAADEREQRHRPSDTSYSDYSYSSSEEERVCTKKAVASAAKQDAGATEVVASPSQRDDSSAQPMVAARSQVLPSASAPMESSSALPSAHTHVAAMNVQAVNSLAVLREMTAFASLFVSNPRHQHQ